MTKDTDTAADHTTGAAGASRDGRVRELLELRARIRALGRRSVTDVFELGGCIALAKTMLPGTAFGPWVRSACGFSLATGMSYVAVHQRLAGCRHRLEQVDVTPAVLFVIAYADEQLTEQTVSALEEGRVLTASEARSLTGVTAGRKAAIDTALSPEEVERQRKAEEKVLAMLNRAFGGLVGSGAGSAKRKPGRRRVANA